MVRLLVILFMTNLCVKNIVKPIKKKLVQDVRKLLRSYESLKTIS